ncbi:MAG: VWA domain-containing protein [Acidobacteriota bacterium]
MTRRLALAVACLLGAVLSAAQAPASATATIRITSPLGRTGVVTRVRIVAQVEVPPGQALSPVSFYVDGKLVGTADAGRYSAVDWVDENPFEERTIVVQAGDAGGRLISDRVVLPPYEVSEQTEVTSILLEAGVYDSAGRFVSDLAPSAFTVRESGVAQKIDLVARESLPTNLVLLVDNSQSMSRTMDFVRLAAERLSEALRQRDKVIVAPFNAHIGTITGPTNDGPTIAQAIKVMRAAGGTAFLDGLWESTKLLEGVEGRRTIVLITDGYDENSTKPIEQVLSSAQAAHVTVYVVGIGGVAGISLRGESMLRRIAEETGGRVFFPPREPDLVSIAGAVNVDAHNRYLITYTPENHRKDGKWRPIVVDVPNGYRVRTRTGYFAPKPAPIHPSLEIRVADARNQFVDIAADDLEVLEDGVVQKVDTFQEAVDPVSIVLDLDASGSMKKSAAAVQEAARDFVAAVRPEDKLALITFADKVVFGHVLATDRQLTLDGIDQYVANGGTALYDAMWTSLTHLKEVPGRHAIVILTDGRDEDNPGTAPGSTHTLDEVLKLGRSVGAMVFPIGLGPNVERKVLERLAAESGGTAYFASESRALVDQFHQIIENLRRRFVIGYTSTNSAHDGGWRAVDIRVRGGGFTVSSLGGFFAPEE